MSIASSCGGDAQMLWSFAAVVGAPQVLDITKDPIRKPLTSY